MVKLSIVYDRENFTIKIKVFPFCQKFPMKKSPFSKQWSFYLGPSTIIEVNEKTGMVPASSH